jgi:hypothetical protein
MKLGHHAIHFFLFRPSKKYLDLVGCGDVLDAQGLIGGVQQRLGVSRQLPPERRGGFVHCA